jgi:hypothetical protein
MSAGSEPCLQADGLTFASRYSYASRHGYALVDKRFFLPELWFTDAYAARRAQCPIPTEVTFQSKPQLAATMLQAIVRGGLLPCK